MKVEIFYPSSIVFLPFDIPLANINDPSGLITMMCVSQVTINFFNNNYHKIYDGDFDDNMNTNQMLEKIFMLFNSDDNPLSARDYQEKIRDLKLHTSMSIGDVVKINDTLWIVDGVGFKKIRK